MALLTLIRVFALTTIFNLILPSGDVYSDVILMVQTWTFQNTESMELIGCRACYGKNEEDLLPSKKECMSCVTRDIFYSCGNFLASMHKLLDIENSNNCEHEKWGVHRNGSLEEGECENYHFCCFEARNNLSKLNDKDENKIYADKAGADCGVSVCKIHLFAQQLWLSNHYKSENGIHDLESWKLNTVYDGNGIRSGGKNCRLLRIYSWSMAIPILINLLFSAVIFFIDLKSGITTKYEIPFLILLLYPQWRTLKILVRYLSHKNVEELINQLDENEKQVSFIEPFCESGLQVSDLFII